MQTLLLIRHGESEWNRQGRVQGFQDSELSDLGREQARRLAGRLAGEHIDHAVASSSSRALETCRIALGAEPQVSDLLREINLGVWEGQESSRLKELYPETMALWFTAPSRVRIEGGETLRSFRRRVSREMERIRAEHPEQTVAVFTHGGVICTYLTYLLGLKLDDMWRFKIRNCSLTKVIFPRGRARLELLGDVSHLDGLLRASAGPWILP